MAPTPENMEWKQEEQPVLDQKKKHVTRAFQLKTQGSLYDTNPNNALLYGKSLKNYHIVALFDAPKMGSISWPLCIPVENRKIFESSNG